MNKKLPVPDKIRIREYFDTNHPFDDYSHIEKEDLIKKINDIILYLESKEIKEL